MRNPLETLTVTDGGRELALERVRRGGPPEVVTRRRAKPVARDLEQLELPVEKTGRVRAGLRGAGGGPPRRETGPDDTGVLGSSSCCR